MTGLSPYGRLCRLIFRVFESFLLLLPLAAAAASFDSDAVSFVSFSVDFALSTTEERRLPTR